VLATLLSGSFIGPCSEKPIHEEEIASQFKTVGDVTVHVLSHSGLPFEGNERGIHSIMGTPIGAEALEVISDQEMRAYGWCYEVDGISPEEFPHQVALSKDSKKVRWYFAYAHFLTGSWIAQCAPAYKIKPAFLCGE
jgi:hypothetical protein